MVKYCTKLWQMPVQQQQKTEEQQRTRREEARDRSLVEMLVKLRDRSQSLPIRVERHWSMLDDDDDAYWRCKEFTKDGVRRKKVDSQDEWRQRTGAKCRLHSAFYIDSCSGKGSERGSLAPGKTLLRVTQMTSRRHTTSSHECLSVNY